MCLRGASSEQSMILGVACVQGCVCVYVRAGVCSDL